MRPLVVRWLDRLPYAAGLELQERLVAARRNGAVPDTLNYEDWLRGKPEAFQREVLGPTKLRLWQSGQLSFTDLVDQGHAPRTVAELKEQFD